MRKLVGAIVVAVALLVTSCGGGSAVVQEEAASLASPDDAAEEQARQLIAVLGSDDAAVDALIIAMDRGYSIQQILDAVASNRLGGDGAVENEDPAEAALNLVLYSVEGEGEGEGAYAPPTRSNTPGEVTLASFYQVQKTPIEEMRDRNTSIGGVGVSGTQRILLLLRSDFTPKDIIEILIFGRDKTVAHPELRFRYCVRVVDELYCPNGERFPVETEPGETETETTPESVTADSNDDTVDGGEPATAPQGGTQLEWKGEFLSRGETGGTVTITRVAGTDDFTFESYFIETEGYRGFYGDSEDNYFCTSVLEETGTGMGTFATDNTSELVFEGSNESLQVWIEGPCTEDEAAFSEYPLDVVEIEPDGLRFRGSLLPGTPPEPLDR